MNEHLGLKENVINGRAQSPEVKLYNGKIVWLGISRGS
jgi:hypothetical protein